MPEVPGYKIERELARGGMGVVYAATDSALRREVVVKTLRPEFAGHPDTTRLFEKETWITGQLSHPGVPPVHARGVLADGRPFLIMKLIRGRTLDDLLANGRGEPAGQLPQLIQVFEQICQTVGFAHSRGFIHRDLKPANVMVGEFGEVQVMDWGLAKQIRQDAPPAPAEGRPAPQPAHLADDDDTLMPQMLGSEAGLETSDRTRFGTVRGTPAYMPPEQARGFIDEIDDRSDVFALGGILCTILTGKPPLTGRTSAEILQRAREGDTSAARTALDTCGAAKELIWLAKHALLPTKTKRPADARAVASAVTAYRAGVEKRLRKAETDRATAAVHAEVERDRQQLVRRLLRTVTALVVGLSTLAVVLVSWLTYIQSKSAFVEKGVSGLRVDTSRQVSDIQREMLELGRGMRVFAARVGERLAPFDPNLAAGTSAPDFEAWWKHEVATTLVRPRRPQGEPPGVRLDGSVIERVMLFGLNGKLVGEGVVRGGELENFRPPSEGITAPVEALVMFTARGGEAAHQVAESTGMLLEDEGGRVVCRLYIARRIFVQSKQGAVTGGRSVAVLVVRLNFTRYLSEMARRDARHNYFLLDSNGVFLHHPDATRVGKTVATDDAFAGFARSKWTGDANAVAKMEEDLAVSDGDAVPANRSDSPAVRIAGLEYYHVKKRLPHATAAQQRRRLCEQFNVEMANFARQPQSEGGPGPGFRYGELTADTSRVEISHTTKEGLDRAKKTIDEILARDWHPTQVGFRDRVLRLFGAPGADWHDDIPCNGFVAQLTLLRLGLGTPLEGRHPPTPGGCAPPHGAPRFVSAAVVAEIEQDAAIAINPARNAMTFVVVVVGALLAIVLARTVTRPLRGFTPDAARRGTITASPNKRG